MITPPALPPPTDRLHFRPYRVHDLDNVIEMFVDDEARRWYPTKGNAEKASQWIQWNIDGYVSNGFGLWVIELRSTGTFLGDCGLTYQRVDGRAVVEVGYHLQAAHRGQGYAGEAAQACLDFALASLDLHSVCSIVDPRNEASCRVASRIHSQVDTFSNDAGRLMKLYRTPSHDRLG